MNFDGNYKNQIAKNDRKSVNLIGKIQKLPLLPKIYLYIAVMAIAGTATGEVKYRLESSNCMTDDSCWVTEPSQRRAKELGAGAIGGIGTATLISLPALFKKD